MCLDYWEVFFVCLFFRPEHDRCVLWAWVSHYLGEWIYCMRIWNIGGSAEVSICGKKKHNESCIKLHLYFGCKNRWKSSKDSCDFSAPLIFNGFVFVFKTGRGNSTSLKQFLSLRCAEVMWHFIFITSQHENEMPGNNIFRPEEVRQIRGWQWECFPAPYCGPASYYYGLCLQQGVRAL